MTRSEQPAMDESWAALQPSDYANDDDSQSDIVDTGSLVDLSSTHDTESIVGDDTPSEPEVEGETENVIVDSQTFTREEEHLEHRELHEDDLVEDTITLQKSDAQPSDGSVAMEYATLSSEDSRVVSSSRTLKERITMTVSTSLLDTKGKPFHIAYFGVPENPDMKEELLGKIGAAIVLPLSSGKAIEDSTSSLYNIVPTEFGLGSKPTFAGLMPSHAQMSVEDIQMVSDDLDHLQITSRRGLVFDSDIAQSHSWRPDLLVVHIDRDVTLTDSCRVDKLVKYTEINAWPTLVVTRNVSGGLCPQAPGSVTRHHEIDDHGSISTISQAIDLESFVVIDTEQINRHLKFLTERSEAFCSENGRFSSVHKLWKSVQHRINPDNSTPLTAQLKEEQRKRNAEATARFRERRKDKHQTVSGTRVEPQEQPKSSTDTPDEQSPEVKRSIMAQVKGWWTTTASRQTLKDTILSFAVLLLGLYITWFSQGLAQSKIAGLQPNTSTAVRASPSIVRITTTSVPVFPDMPSDIPTIDQDVMVYEQISFDQVWSRLTGKSQDTEEKKIEAEPQDKPTVPQKATSSDNKIVDEKPKITNSLTNILNSSRNALDRLIDRLEARLARLEAGMELKREKQAQIEEMNQKILDFWAEIPRHLRLASKHSHERYQQLIRKSQKHIRRARWATDKRLEDIVKEQKKLLSRAQYQAQLLTRDIPRRKRGGLFKKGGMKYGRFWR